MGDAEQSITYADRGDDAFMKISTRTNYADALHQAGHRTEAETLFYNTEQMWSERYPQSPLMSSLAGFQYCNLLLNPAERAAWQTMLHLNTQGSALSTAADSCRAVEKRAAQTLKWVTTQNWLLDIALDHLTLGRAGLYKTILTNSEFQVAGSDLESAVSGLRRANRQDHLPRGLLALAWFRTITNDHTGAQTDLNEAWEIAERGPMRLFMADIHLYRTRLFFRETHYPWDSPAADLAAARQLIEQCGYGRRKEELEDAEEALKQHLS